MTLKKTVPEAYRDLGPCPFCNKTWLTLRQTLDFPVAVTCKFGCCVNVDIKHWPRLEAHVLQSIDHLCDHETPMLCFFCQAASETDYAEPRGRHAVYCRNCWQSGPLESNPIKAVLMWNAQQRSLEQRFAKNRRWQERSIEDLTKPKEA